MVPDFLEVGDVLLGAGSAATTFEIVRIETVVKSGFMAPLTSDGTIAVNGVVTSSYVFPTPFSLDQPSDYDYVLYRYKIMSINAFSHVRSSPLRLASLGISPWFGTLADEEGMYYLVCAYRLAGTWMHSSAHGFFVVTVGTVFFNSLCGIAFFPIQSSALLGQ